MEDKCWLCGQCRELTREHIPPKRAFNDKGRLYYEISEYSKVVGEIRWEQKEGKKGLVHKSLCAKCNGKCGRMYGGSYVNFIKEVAEKLEQVSERGTITLSAVKYPLRILKAIAQCFVSANGPKFVDKNPWLRKFLRDSRNKDWPNYVYLYIFGTSTKRGRTTGLSGILDVKNGRSQILSEFTFWPLGAILSFNKLNDDNLYPIHSWSQYGFHDEVGLMVDLPVNTFATMYPMDFRSSDEVVKDARDRENK